MPSFANCKKTRRYPLGHELFSCLFFIRFILFFRLILIMRFAIYVLWGHKVSKRMVSEFPMALQLQIERFDLEVMESSDRSVKLSRILLFSMQKHEIV